MRGVIPGAMERRSQCRQIWQLDQLVSLPDKWKLYIHLVQYGDMPSRISTGSVSCSVGSFHGQLPHLCLQCFFVGQPFIQVFASVAFTRLRA